MVIYICEGYCVDLSDCLLVKLMCGGKIFIGELGLMGCILVRGEVGYDIIFELYLVVGELVIDKFGKGVFY